VTVDSALLAYVGIVTLLTILPGADMALVAKVTLLEGRRAAFLTSLGITAGLPVHATASALGLSLVLATSAEAFMVMKLAGAAYLVYLGIRTLRSSLKARPAIESGYGRPRAAAGAFVQGLLTNVLNPKVALFYLTFLPQFIVPSDSVLTKSLLLAGIHASLGVVWLVVYSLAIDRLGAAVQGARRWIERISAGALIGLGLRLAFERR
jgi:threonine/homoserine/homoserine lactone efflux protein